MKKKKLQCSVPTLLLAGVLCLTLAACGAKQPSDMPASDTDSTQNFLGVQPKCSQVCKFVKDFRPDLLGVRTAGIEVPCKLVEIAAHLAALSKQGGNGGQGFFSAAGNDDRFLDLDVVDGAADKSGEGEIQEFASEFQ